MLYPNSFLSAHDSIECCWVSSGALRLFVVVLWFVLTKCNAWVFTACFVHGHLSTQATCLQMPALRFLKILLKRATVLGCAMCLGSQPPALALPDVFAQNYSSLCPVLQHPIIPKGHPKIPVLAVPHDTLIFWKLKPFQAIPAMLNIITH